MSSFRMNRQLTILLLGDMIVLGLVTLFGFATHGELQTAGWRMLTTFLPLAAAWLAAALPLDIYTLPMVRDPKQLWRTLWTALLAGPLAAWLRSLYLDSTIIPVFVAVMMVTSGLGTLIWRVSFLFLLKRKMQFDG